MATVERRPLPSTPGVRRPILPWTERLYFALNAHGGRVLALQLAMYFSAAFALSSLKPFWFDELITFDIARQASIHAIWNLLLRAADPNPPLSHLFAFVSIRLFGNGELAVRLPSICAGAITLLCIHEFLVRRVASIFASVGVFFYMTTHAFDYSYEVRSYSFLVCFAAVVLLAWRWTHETRRKRMAALLLAAALALGLSSNYYGVLIFFPLAAGELVSTVQRRRIAWPVWVAFAAGAAPLIAYLPLVHAAVARFSPYAWNKPYPEFIIDAYSQMLEASSWLALAVVYSVVVIINYERLQLGIRRTPILRLPELVAVTLLATFPVLGYLMSVIRGGMISSRFVLPFCIGVSIAFAIAGFKIAGRSYVLGLVFVLVSFCWFACRAGDMAADYSNQRQALDRIIATLPEEGMILVPDSLLATPLNYYAPPKLAARLVFPMDLAAVRKYKREDSPEQNLAAAPEIYSVPIIPLDDFQNAHSSYYVLGPDDNWLLQELRDDEVPAHRVPLDFRSHDLGGFTPLAHRDVSLFRVDSFDPGTYKP